MEAEQLTYIINGAIFEVNRQLGTGFLEKVYENSLAVELRNVLAASLARNLPASLLFDYPSIDALTRHLGDDVLELQLENDQGPPSAHFSGATAGDSGADIVTMSDEEAEAQLLQELANLREAGSGRS